MKKDQMTQGAKKLDEIILVPYDITDADKGYVWGLDYAGPFPPDVDGNVYFLQGVEVGSTNMGYVQLTGQG